MLYLYDYYCTRPSPSPSSFYAAHVVIAYLSAHKFAMIPIGIIHKFESAQSSRSVLVPFLDFQF